MPIYEYRCAPCDEVFEELIIRSADERDVRCPTCKGKDVARVMSRPAAAKSATSAPGGRACGPVG